MRRKSYDYSELVRLRSSPELKAQALAGELTHDTMERIGHLARFYKRLGKALPNPNMRIGDGLTGEEVDSIWYETANPEADHGQRPALN
jgi:hypothetical protein